MKLQVSALRGFEHGASFSCLMSELTSYNRAHARQTSFCSQQREALHVRLSCASGRETRARCCCNGMISSCKSLSAHSCHHKLMCCMHSLLRVSTVAKFGTVQWVALSDMHGGFGAAELIKRCCGNQTQISFTAEPLELSIMSHSDSTDHFCSSTINII